MSANTVCKYNKKFKAFSVDHSVVQGVIPRLRSLFYPSYSYATATHGSEEHRSHSVPLSVTPARKFKGTRRGIITDNQMQNSVRWFHTYNIPIEAFCSHTAARTYATRHKAHLPKVVYTMMTKSLSLPVMKLWQLLRTVRLTPQRTQVPVGVKEWHIGTAVDLLCTDSTGCHVVVEVKTGYETYYHKHTGNRMRLLAGKITDSAANQHQLQLLVTCELYRISSGATKPVRGLLFHVRDCGIDVIPLQKWAIDNRQVVMNAIAQSH